MDQYSRNQENISKLNTFPINKYGSSIMNTTEMVEKETVMGDYHGVELNEETKTVINNTFLGFSKFYYC